MQTKSLFFLSGSYNSSSYYLQSQLLNKAIIWRNGRTQRFIVSSTAGRLKLKTRCYIVCIISKSYIRKRKSIMFEV